VLGPPAHPLPEAPTSHELRRSFPFGNLSMSQDSQRDAGGVKPHPPTQAPRWAKTAWEPPEEQENGEHPLGPLVEIVRLDHALWGRCYAFGLMLVTGALLAVAFSLTPSNIHMGTHQKLGLPPCGFVTLTGLPCPTCGMTTAYAHTIRGQLGSAFYAQAAGTVLAIGTILVFVLSLMACVTAQRPSINWYRIDPTHIVWYGVLVVFLAWALKILIGHLDGTLPLR